MAKNKININPSLPSDEQIANYRNFDSVLEKFNTTPTPGGGDGGTTSSLFQSTWFVTTVATVAVVTVAVIAYITLREPDRQITPPATADTEAEAPEQKSIINPPIKDLDIPYAVFNLDAQQGQTVEYLSGTKLIIPKNAFLDANGNVVHGKVQLKYREMHDAVDIFVAGVPMKYDSAGGDFFLESAGMCEILASQNNKELFANPQAQIQVQMASFREGDDYNLYYLSEENKRWELRGKPGYEPKERDRTYDASELKVEYLVREYPDNANADIFDAVAVLPPPPIKPKAVDPAKPTISIDIDVKEYPEMEPFSNIMWQYAGTADSMDPSKNTWAFQTTWSDVRVERQENNDVYKLIFSRPGKKFTTLVQPVFGEADIEEAEKVYKEKFRQYENLRRNQEASIYRDRQRMQQQITQPPVAFVSQQQSDMVRAVRSFGVTRFGTWNCDTPIPRPKGPAVIAGFESLQGEKVESTAYLIDVKKNTVFPVWEKQEFTFDPSSKSYLINSTIDGNMALYTPSDFAHLNKTIKSRRDRHKTLVFDVHDKKYTNVEDLRKELMKAL